MTFAAAGTNPPPNSNQDSGASSLGECPNCGAALRGPYCSQCGEKFFTRSDHSFKHVLEEVVGEFAHLDGRFYRTIKTLVRKPGELERAYFHGGRSRYTKPLTLFVMLNLVFFLVQPHTGLLGYHYHEYLSARHSGDAHAARIREKLMRTHEPERSYEARFNAVLQEQKKSVLLISVPVIALVMLVLFAGSGRTYVEHLVFSVHLYTYLLVFFLMLILAAIPIFVGLSFLGSAGAHIARLVESELAISLIVPTGITIYIYKAAKRSYGLSGPLLVVRALLVALSIGFLTGVYRDVLFYTVLWST